MNPIWRRRRRIAATGQPAQWGVYVYVCGSDPDRLTNMTIYDVDFEFEDKTSEASGPSKEDGSVTGEFGS